MLFSLHQVKSTDNKMTTDQKPTLLPLPLSAGRPRRGRMKKHTRNHLMAMMYLLLVIFNTASIVDALCPMKFITGTDAPPNSLFVHAESRATLWWSWHIDPGAESCVINSPYTGHHGGV